MNTTNEPVSEEKVVKPIFRKVETAKVETPPSTGEAEKGKLVDAVEKPEKPTLQKADPPKVLMPEENYLSSPLFYKVANYFGLTTPQQWELAKNQLSVITDWAVLKSESIEGVKILEKIRELEDSLRSPGYGETRHANVYRFVRLLGQQENLERELKVYKPKENIEENDKTTLR